LSEVEEVEEQPEVEDVERIDTEMRRRRVLERTLLLLLRVPSLRFPAQSLLPTTGSLPSSAIFPWRVWTARFCGLSISLKHIYRRLYGMQRCPIGTCMECTDVQSFVVAALLLFAHKYQSRGLCVFVK
jgi:hypothetical protein